MDLSKYGIYVSFTYGNQKTYCPQCKDTRKNKNRHDKPLSVTFGNDGVVWNCHNCNWRGSEKMTDYNNFKKTFTNVTPIKKPTIPKEPQITETLLEFLKKRNISQKTAENLKLFETKKQFSNGLENCIAFPYVEDGKIVNIKYRSYDKQFRQEANAKRTLFNIDSINGKEIIFCEGEMDVVAFYEAGITNAVSLPDGANKDAKFDENDKRFTALGNTEKLHSIQKVYIATDMDVAGQSLSAELVHRFGSDRCYRVNFPKWKDKQIKDANECLIAFGKQELKKCLKDAQPFPIEGIYKPHDYLDQIYDLYNGLQTKPFSTGFKELDKIYKLMPSTFNVVTGIPNHGKSNFLDQLMMNTAMIHNWKFAIFSPEHSTVQHLRRLAEIFCKRPFDVGFNTRMSENDLKLAIDWLQEHFVFIENKDSVPTIDWLLQKMRGACLRHGINGVLIDPYNEIDASRKTGKREDEHIRDLISQCKKFCRTHNIIMWMVAHPSKLIRQTDGAYPVPSMYDISGSAHWHNMADVGLVVHRLFEEEQTLVCTRKIREQGYYGNIGECFFRYDVGTKNYEEIKEEITPSQSHGIYQD